MGYNYVFKDGSKCVRISYENKDLWTHNSTLLGNNYPKRIFYTTIYDDTKLVVYLNDGYFTYRNNGVTWNMTDSAIPGRKTLEITDLRSSNEFKFYRDDTNKRCVYLPNQGMKLVQLQQNGKKLWDWDKAGVPADYVMITDMGTEEENIVIHLVNGKQETVKPDGNVKQPSKLEDRIQRRRIINSIKFVLLGCGLGITALIGIYLKFKR